MASFGAPFFFAKKKGRFATTVGQYRNEMGMRPKNFQLTGLTVYELSCLSKGHRRLARNPCDCCRAVSFWYSWLLRRLRRCGHLFRDFRFPDHLDYLEPAAGRVLQLCRVLGPTCAANPAGAVCEAHRGAGRGLVSARRQGLRGTLLLIVL